MQILSFNYSLAETGGAELLAVDQARYFQEQGESVRLLTFRLDSPGWKGALDGLDVEVMGTDRAKELLSLSGPVRKLALRARKAGRHFGGRDVVLATNYPASAMLGEWCASAKERRALAIGYCHEPPRRLNLLEANPHLAATLDHSVRCRAADDLAASLRDQRARHARLRARDIRASQHLDLLVGSSRFSSELLERVYGRPVDAVLPPMVRFPAGVTPRAAPNRDALQILFHSRLVSPKNADTLLRAFRLLRTRGHARAALHIVGKGPEREYLGELAEDLGLGDAVHFHGFLSREALEELYAKCDVFAVPTIDEPFGMVFVEAIGRGLLVVGPNHGGPAEILEEGRLGAVADPFDPEALAAALDEVSRLDAVAADRRREEALRSCIERFDRDRVGQRWLALLREARARPGAAGPRGLEAT